MKLQVINSPFNEEQVKLLNELLPKLTSAQKVWLNGYLAATSVSDVIVEEVIEAGSTPTVGAPAAPPQTRTVTVLFASQTGNAQKLAQNIGAELQTQGLEVEVASMAKFKPNNLKKVEDVLIVASTNGEGEPPDNALGFHEFLYSKRAPKLDHVRFAVLALGDTSYEFYCKTGHDFNNRFLELGAQALLPIVECDVDYEEPAAKWFTDVKQVLATATETTAASSQETSSPATAVEYTRNKPFAAEIVEKINLNMTGSNKHTTHLEISLENSGITYEPGDSLGIVPKNNEQLVDALIATLKFDASKTVPTGDTTQTLRDALINHYEITVLSKPLLQKIAEFTTHSDFQNIVTQTSVKDFVYGRDLLDIAESYGPFSWTEEQFVSLLRKIPGRLYSISSAQSAVDEEVHVTIGRVGYEAYGRERFGVASTQVADQLEIGDTVNVYVHKNPNFKLPAEDKPVIMIGPGTGIAPFRSFLQEREETGATGESWLFFGEQHFVTDFLYQTELQAWLANGTLTNLHVAFSRDTDQKVYVQHRMQEQAEELYKWLQNGAYIYVCGDEKHMAKDVEQTLIDIVATQGNLSQEQASAYIKQLQQDERYLRDVY
ncbi:assimilatory sulfite reductase (NADPH) flavoprotein subunit [Caryophanon tenue]|uniref:assimilatory sulfite reductase (NADPH) n=1 Tax=Caryophanon tenue TaxID=33978 RepID=A0A1C0YKV6_9BACL|nr:assimilatory sulfite reductase (NADPH) flavoprotein subunit [Caryophanon tenue]OCS87793.1 sulfite reductase [NADPH] flavoprotein, alpha-component [Caryophanon tenue]